MSELLNPEVFRHVVEEMQVGVYFTDLQRRIVFWNAGAERITGYLSQQVVGRCCRENILMHCDHQQELVCGKSCPLAEAMAEAKPKEASLFLQHKTGHRIPVRIHTMPLRDAAGAVIGAAEIFQRHRDVPHQERRENGGAWMYTVRGVPDFGFTMSELRQRLMDFHGSGVRFGMLFVQVDRFEELRVHRGNEACETVLHVIANTFQNTIRPGDFLGMWTGGRLMLLLASPVGDAVMRAGERVRGLAARSSVVWWGDAVPVTVSCGGTPVREGDTMDGLVQRGERALGESLAGGGDRVTVVNE